MTLPSVGLMSFTRKASLSALKAVCECAGMPRKQESTTKNSQRKPHLLQNQSIWKIEKFDTLRHIITPSYKYKKSHLWSLKYQLSTKSTSL